MRALLLLAMIALGCESEGLVVVHVDATERVRERADELLVRVFAPGQSEPLYDNRAPITDDGAGVFFPTFVPVRQASEQRFRIEVRVRDEGEVGFDPEVPGVILREERIFAFTEGERVDRTMILDERCIDVPCDAFTTCFRGECVDPATIPEAGVYGLSEPRCGAAHCRESPLPMGAYLRGLVVRDGRVYLGGTEGLERYESPDWERLDGGRVLALAATSDAVLAVLGAETRLFAGDAEPIGAALRVEPLDAVHAFDAWWVAHEAGVAVSRDDARSWVELPLGPATALGPRSDSRALLVALAAGDIVSVDPDACDADACATVPFGSPVGRVTQLIDEAEGVLVVAGEQLYRAVGTDIFEPQIGGAGVRAVGVLPDGRALAGAYSGSLHVREGGAWRALGNRFSGGHVADIEPWGEGRFAVIAGQHPYLFDLADERERAIDRSLTQRARAVAWDPDRPGRAVLVAGDGGAFVRAPNAEWSPLGLAEPAVLEDVAFHRGEAWAVGGGNVYRTRDEVFELHAPLTGPLGVLVAGSTLFAGGGGATWRLVGERWEAGPAGELSAGASEGGTTYLGMVDGALLRVTGEEVSEVARAEAPIESVDVRGEVVAVVAGDRLFYLREGVLEPAADDPEYPRLEAVLLDEAGEPQLAIANVTGSLESFAVIRAESGTRFAWGDRFVAHSGAFVDADRGPDGAILVVGGASIIRVP